VEPSVSPSPIDEILPLEQRCSLRGAPRSNRSRELIQTRDRIVPTDAGIGNAAAIHKLFTRTNRLIALDKVAFQHDAKNPRFAVFNLRTHVLTDGELVAVIFAAVGMTHVDHDPDSKSRLIE
jgi:hypothetical protein